MSLSFLLVPPLSLGKWSLPPSVWWSQGSQTWLMTQGKLTRFPCTFECWTKTPGQEGSCGLAIRGVKTGNRSGSSHEAFCLVFYRVHFWDLQVKDTSQRLYHDDASTRYLVPEIRKTGSSSSRNWEFTWRDTYMLSQGYENTLSESLWMNDSFCSVSEKVHRETPVVNREH